jgi:hypothetical protein
MMISENRRKRRKKERKPPKDGISKKDRVYSIIAIVLLFLLATILVLVQAFS